MVREALIFKGALLTIGLIDRVKDLELTKEDVIKELVISTIGFLFILGINVIRKIIINQYEKRNKKKS